MFATNKRIVTVIVMALIIAIALPMFVTAAEAGGYQAGEIITFGAYEQDNLFYNGAEEIEWIILEVQSDRMLLLSRYALDSERYHYRKENVTWDTCSVRDWLNDTFYWEAFTRSERECILSSGTSLYDDYVFFLSDEETEEYLPRSKDRICKATPYCAGQNVYVNPSTGGSWWLLRTTGDDGNKFAMSVNSDGTIDYNGGHVESDRGTVRPAIWLKTGGKNAASNAVPSTPKDDQLHYPISEEACYVIYKNYFGYDMKCDDSMEVVVDRFGKGDKEVLCFSIYRLNENWGGLKLQGTFEVYVNTGVCVRDDITFQADEFYP